MATVPTPEGPHVDWGLVVGVSLAAIGVIASVATHRLWRIVFGVGAWFVLCATFVYATAGLGATLPWRIGVVILATLIAGIFAWPEMRRKRKNTMPRLQIDPSAPLYKGATIRLADLVPQGAAAIRGKVFEDCEIIGPAVIHPDGPIDLTDVQFTGSQNTFLIEAEAVSGSSGPDGVIYIRDSVFRRCSFAQVGIIGTKATIVEYRKRLSPRVDGPAMTGPLVKGHVERFERVDGYYVSEWRGKDLERRLRRTPTQTERLGHALAEIDDGHWYIAWLKVETTGTPSKTDNWACYVNLKDGEKLLCDLTMRDWGAPPTWPSVKYHNLVELQSMFLQNQTLYNVLVLVRLKQSEGELNMNSFRVSFTDDNGLAIECLMRGSAP